MRRLIVGVASRRGADVTIGPPGDPYMMRWHVVPRNRVFNVYLHLILRSDDAEVLHDHPWWNLSLVLRGRYVEHTISAGGVHHRAERAAGDWKFRRAGDAHRIEILDGECCTTLFLTGPRIRRWGFHCPGGWVPWEKFNEGGCGEDS